MTNLSQCVASRTTTVVVRPPRGPVRASRQGCGANTSLHELTHFLDHISTVSGFLMVDMLFPSAVRARYSAISDAIIHHSRRDMAQCRGDAPAVTTAPQVTVVVLRDRFHVALSASERSSSRRRRPEAALGALTEMWAAA